MLLFHLTLYLPQILILQILVKVVADGRIHFQAHPVINLRRWPHIAHIGQIMEHLSLIGPVLVNVLIRQPLEILGPILHNGVKLKIGHLPADLALFQRICRI